MIDNKPWKNLFLFGLGLAIGTSFCMKWMESDLWVNGKQFSILGLELFYSKDKVSEILNGLDEQTRMILRYHLCFDFAFMSGIFPAIASLCMMVYNKATSFAVKKCLLVLAWLQLVAWGMDITENYYLLQFVDKKSVGNYFPFFHFVVAAKWSIALLAVTIAVAVILFRSNKITKGVKTHFLI